MATIEVPCQPIPKWSATDSGSFLEGFKAVGPMVACPRGWSGINYTSYNDTTTGSAITIESRYYDAAFVHLGTLPSQAPGPLESQNVQVDDPSAWGLTDAERDQIAWVQMWVRPGATQTYTAGFEVNFFLGLCLEEAVSLMSRLATIVG